MANQKVLQSPGAELKFFYGYIIIGAAFFIMMAMEGVYYSFGVFFKPLLTDFGWTSAMTSGAFSLAMITRGLLAIVMGGLTDRLGPRMVMTLCGFLLGIGYLLMSQISAVWQLYLFFGLIVGAGMGGSFIPAVSTVARWFVKRRSMMTGIVIAGIGAGSLIAAPLANWLISTYNWRVSYIVLGSIVLVIIVSAAQVLRRDPAQMGQRPYGEGEGEEQRLRVEADSFSLKEAIYTKQFWLFSGLMFCFGFCEFTTVVHIVRHAIELGISPVSAASVLATIGGMSIVGRIGLGSAGDRIGNKQIFIIGFILMSAVLFWVVPATEAWRLFLFASIFGLAYGGCAVSGSPLIAELFGLRSHGMILGFIGVAYTSGAAIGPFLAGYIFDINGNYQLAFLVCGAIGVVGLILAALLTPTKKS